MSNKEKLEEAEKQTETNLTQEQRDSGNYLKGKVELNGLSIVIENPRGSVRKGTDQSGISWECTMLYTYGYLENTIGSDQDEIDVFIGPLVDNFTDVFIVTQITPSTGLFDEHKVLLGFSNIDEAKAAYLSSYTPDWKGLKNIKLISLSDLKEWLANKTIQSNSMIENIPRVKTIKLEGEVLADVTLLDLQKQAGDIDDFDSLELEIASPGGDVSEGLKTMVWLDTLSIMDKEVTTIVTANAYSIASLIMLAANKRKISKTAKVMVHNPMKPELTLVNANDLEEYIKELRGLEDYMHILYGIFTGIEKEDIKSLMDNETYLTADMAVQFGFADEIVDIKPRPDSVAINKSNKINMKSTLNILNSVIAMVRGSEVVNQLYYDNQGGELEIYQKDPASYAEGDKTNIVEGTRVLSDGATITIADSVITGIERGVSALEPSTTEPAVAVPVVEPVAVEGPAPAVDPLVKPVVVVEPVVAPVAVAEPVVEPVVAVVEPVVPVVEPVVASAEPVVEPAALPDMAAVIKGFEETINALQGRVKALEEGGLITEEKLTAQSKFEALATEAIDTIAKNTVSNFAPIERTAVNIVPVAGSIFAQLKAKAAAAK